LSIPLDLTVPLYLKFIRQKDVNNYTTATNNFRGGIMESGNEEDIEFLIQNIRISIQAVIDKLDIAYIDKNTENRLIDLCLQDKRYLKGQYDSKYLEEMIERELIEAI
jgi:hypothetical protein